MSRLTLRGATVEREAKLDDVKCPAAIEKPQAREREAYSATYRVGKLAARCVVKELHCHLTRAAAQARLVRVAPLLVHRWRRPAVTGNEVIEALTSQPVAAVPVDYWRTGRHGPFDAAILPHAGEIKLQDLVNVPSTFPPELHDCLARRDSRIRILRALASAVQTAQLARLGHFDVCDRNILLSYEADQLRAAIIDWDEGIEADQAGGGARLIDPLDDQNYPWTPELRNAFAAAPWTVDSLALIRYLLWIYNVDCAQLTDATRGFHGDIVSTIRQATAKAATLTMHQLLRRITRLIERVQVGDPKLASSDIPRPLEITVALRAELAASSGARGSNPAT